MRIKVKSDNVISIGDPTTPAGTGGLRDAITGSYVNDATVTLIELLDKRTRTRVTGFTPPLALAYVAASNGVYSGTLESAICDNLIGGREYEGEILAVQGSTVRSFFLSAFAERDDTL